MNELNKFRAEALVKSDDKWFAGVCQKTESGEITYFICEHFRDREIDGEHKQVCTAKDIIIENIDDVCNMSCDTYGRCDNCRGWTAIRCEACVIPRP